MNDTTTAVIEDAAPVPAIEFVEGEGEAIHAPAPLLAELRLSFRTDGQYGARWHVGVVATLPEDTFDMPLGNYAHWWSSTTRAVACSAACEELIAWCSDQKERGSKRHKQQAAELQDWALEVEKRETAAAAIAADITAGTLMVTDEISNAVADGGSLVQGLSVLHTRTNEGELHQAALPQSLVDGELRMIPIDQLFESPWNPRQYYPEVQMAELTQSMRESGFREWLPLMVRPISASSEVWRTLIEAERGGYEIGAGHRRSRAAREAGITMIPCIVRPLNDEQFLDVLNFDNTGREDVHPLHEASGWRTWMERTGKGVLDIAAKIGQSKEYVYQRLKYSALIPDAQRAFLDGKITAAHAILIARQQPDGQKKALKHLEPPKWAPEKIPSVRDLDAWLHQSLYEDLNRAAFDREDASLLSGSGVCSTCPKRAANDPAYRPAPEADDGSDVCTDPRCYSQKLTNHLVRIKTAAGGEVIEVSDNWSAKKKGTLNTSQYEVVGKGESGKNVKTAVITEGRDIGKVVKVRVKAAQTAGPSQKEQAAERVAAQQKREKETELELSIRRAILAAVRPKIGGLARSDVQALLAVLIEQKHGYGGDDFSVDELCRLHDIKFNPHQARFALVPALAKMSDTEISQLAVEASAMPDFLEWKIGQSNEKPEALLALAKRYKVDAAKIRSEMEEAAKEAEGGTRKEVIKKLPVLGAPKAAKPAPASSAPAAPPTTKAPAKKAPAKKAAPKAKAAPVKKSAPAKAAKKGGKK